MIDNDEHTGALWVLAEHLAAVIAIAEAQARRIDQLEAAALIAEQRQIGTDRTTEIRFQNLELAITELRLRNAPLGTDESTQPRRLVDERGRVVILRGAA